MVFLGFNGSERGILEVVDRGLVGKGNLINVFCVPTQTRHNGVNKLTKDGSGFGVPCHPFFGMILIYISKKA